MVGGMFSLQFEPMIACWTPEKSTCSCLCIVFLSFQLLFLPFPYWAVEGRGIKGKAGWFPLVSTAIGWWSWLPLATAAAESLSRTCLTSWLFCWQSGYSPPFRKDSNLASSSPVDLLFFLHRCPALQPKNSWALPSLKWTQANLANKTVHIWFWRI